MEPTTTISFVRQNPVRTGVFAVLGVLALGIAAGFALGYDLPQKVAAQVVTLPPVTVVGPVAPTPVVVPVVPVIVPTTPVVPVTTPTDVVPDVVVVGERPDNDTQTTDPGTRPPDVVPDVVVVGERPDSRPDDPFGPPCCTEQPPTTPPTPPQPPVTPDDPFGPPCCTEQPPQPPVTPPVVPPVTPPVTPEAAQCVSLTISASSIQPGQSVTLSWQTRNATSISIDNGIGIVTPTESGSIVVTPTQSTTYTATVTGATGSVNCQASVVVVDRPLQSAQCVFLSATPGSIQRGQSVTLSWQTRNATSISIDNGIGIVTPTESGSIVVTPTQSTTYTATVTGATGSVNCQASVVVTSTPVPAQCIFLNGTPSVINAGDPVRLSWQTRNATSISIDNGVGSVTPVEEGFVIVNPTRTTTYIATVTGATGSVNCQTTVTVTTIEQGPACVSLSASDTSIEEGESVTLTWVTNRANRAEIDNGVGSVTPVDGGSVTVSPNSDTTYRLTVNGSISNSNCLVSIDVGDDDDGGGGGGGGGGRRTPRVVLDSFVPDLEEPLSYVYLSEVPYTGLELGTWGTVLYWTMLIGWSAALAYLVLFNAVPFAFARVKRFGASVKDAMNGGDAGHAAHSAHGHVAPAAHASHNAGHGHATDHSAHTAPAPAKPAGYNAHDGFRSFAAGEGLTIDDIVKGLSREIEQKQQVAHAPAAPTHAEVLEAVHETPAPAPVLKSAGPAVAPAIAPVNENVRDFIKALLDGDRDTVFGTIRAMAREGQDTELFVSHAACALDDAYRACIDGTTCHPDIAELTKGCHPSFLERLVSSLTTAVDGSYSAGMTGVKMALTRALGVVAG